ncbi:MAG: tetratricopeptide repeat protein [Gammaproteobacteria bacterium]|nr:tetratricopeptide repeat protein [Gammaproteobacteria bacterium]
MHYPRDANLLCLAARVSLVQKNFAEAKIGLDKAIKLHPDFAPAHDVFGDVLLAEGYVELAVKAYEQALRLDPTRANLVKKLDFAHGLAAETPPAATIPAPSTGRQMAYAEQIGEAEQLLKSGDPQKAEDIFRDILKRDPNHVEAARQLAAIATENKKYRDAEVFLRHAATNAPDYVRVWVDLANVLREREKLDDALDCALHVLELASDRAEPHMLHANVLGTMGRHEEAIEAYERSLEIAPGKAASLCSMGHHQKTIGRTDDAIASYRECIASKADHAEAYWSLANLKTFQFEEDEVVAMQDLLMDEQLPDESRVQLHNALGLEFEARKDYDKAFRHYKQCNGLRRESESYDPVEFETGMDRVIEIMDAGFFADHEGVGDPDPAPIFVVGLPRSGSTLIEQILASHSLVDGTHELGDLPRIVNQLGSGRGKGPGYPDKLLELSADDWSDAGRGYLAATQKYRAGAPYFIDKNPNNFMYIGLLRLILPNAKIINARRHPLDSCFGSYKQLFASGQPFSYDLVELGEYYLQYQRLVDHFHEVIPGFVLDVEYENVVGDFEVQVRRILDYCGLPFEEACLRFHETTRAVKTASSEQVRQPIYASSVNLWKRYESNLGELVEVLQPLLDRLPPTDRPSTL